jgi:hypothetical protein
MSFSLTHPTIWPHADIAKGSMMTPPDTADPLDSINALLGANTRQQKLLTESLRQPKQQGEKARKFPFTPITSLVNAICYGSLNTKKGIDFLNVKKHARIGVTNCRGSKSIDLEAGEGSDSGAYVRSCSAGQPY